MLFDLRGRGRRRAVQVIYVTLALLMGGGLIFFGIGGSVSGGLFDAIGLTNSGGNSSNGGSNILAKQRRAAERRVRVNPKDATAWADLTRLHYQLAGQGDNYDQGSQQFKPGGRRELAQASSAWQRYLQVKAKQPDPELAALMVQAYGPTALNDPKQGVTAAEILAQGRPSAQAYYELAVFAYAAGQARKGDLASQRAVALTPAVDRPSVKTRLDAIKKQGGPTQGSAGATQIEVPAQ